MDGSRFVRIEVDDDEDGSVDRWEYFNADGKLENDGTSRADDRIATVSFDVTKSGKPTVTIDYRQELR